MIHKYEYTIQKKDIDVFGHMNHANYLHVFEEARWDWMNQKGYGLQRILETQVGPTILGLTVEYKRELREGQRIRIESSCTDFRGKIAYVEQKMFNEKKELCCFIRLTFALFDMQRRKLITPTPEWLRALGVVAQAD